MGVANKNLSTFNFEDMKKFIKNIAIFSALILSVGCIIELYLRTIPCDESYKRTLLDEHGCEFKNMIIGSSVSAWGIDPTYLPDSTYNVACTRQWISSNKLMVERYSTLTPNIKAIIWGISVQCMWGNYFIKEFGRKTNKDIDKITHEQIFLDFQMDNDIRLHSLFLSCPKGIKAKTFNSLGFDTTHLSKLSKGDWPSKIEGRIGQYAKTDTDEMKTTYVQNVQCMEDVVSLCRKKGIHVYFVMPPIYQGLTDLIPNDQFKEINQAMNKIVAQYDNASWHDYSHDTRFTIDDFIDEIHLNADKGAIKFSKILNEDLFVK
jgi:hypothetical protein